MLLTLAKYTEITGDAPAASAFSPAASAAQDLLEDALGRRGQLEEAERTEQVHYKQDGTLYPMATPITAVEGGLLLAEDVVYGATPDSGVFVGYFGPVDPPIVTLTYTGGWTSANAPAYMIHDLAWATYELLRPEAAVALAGTPTGASSAHSGDVSVSWGAGAGAPANVTTARFGWSFQTLRHKRRSP